MCNDTNSTQGMPRPYSVVRTPCGCIVKRFHTNVTAGTVIQMGIVKEVITPSGRKIITRYGQL